MAVRVLIVDDSRFFRRRVTEIINSDPQLEVIGAAVNGREAVELVAKLKPDVVTMDIEMPVMDGISAVRHIMNRTPTPILMFSSLTTDGAQSTLDALDAGAVDFLPKRFEDISKDRDEVKRQLCMRVRQIGAKTRKKAIVHRPLGSVGTSLRDKTIVTPERKPKRASPGRLLSSGALRSYSLLAIGASTGGPVALQEILTTLPKTFPLPIVLVQHMPSSFTPAFATRLDKLCQITVKEAQDGDFLASGTAFLAPGGRQMVLERRGSNTVLKICDAQSGQYYKPSVDTTFMSVAKVFPGKVLALILTGMGADGREGVRVLKRDKSTVWAQNEETCVVFGMPGAVVDAGLADSILPLSEIGTQLKQGV